MNREGRRGEEEACRLIAARGGTVLARNYHSRWGEIDIIARSGRYILFVEVKTRGARTIAPPQEFVSPAKQRRIVRTALAYLAAHPTALQPRVDVIGLTVDAHGKFEHPLYIENAFGAGGDGYAPF